MINELFKSIPTLSPRIRWMIERNIYCVDTKKGFTCFRSGNTKTAFADTEEEACMQLAAKLKLKSWKEEV